MRVLERVSEFMQRELDLSPDAFAAVQDGELQLNRKPKPAFNTATVRLLEQLYLEANAEALQLFAQPGFHVNMTALLQELPVYVQRSHGGV
jgi:hypothetical protein